jgi:type I restriction-modification system DNA methylase subunit
MVSERDVEYQIKSIFQHIPEFKNIHSDVPVDGKRADLVIYKDEVPHIVVEVKKQEIDPATIDVVDQASFYAYKLGADYFATTNGKNFILFETFRPGTGVMERKLKYFPVDESLPKKVLGEITTGVRWMSFDDAFVTRLQTLHEILTPNMSKSLSLDLENKKFREEFEKWVTEQGFSYESRDEKIKTEEIIARQSAYLLINKILFYKVLEAVFPSLPKLRSIQTLNISSYLQEYFKSALKIDYRAIFEQGFFDKISILPEVAATIVKFIKELELYDFEKIKSDVIGRIYERLIPADHRKTLGQYYTPPSIIELILKLTLKNPDSRILDPCCGSGGFLIGTYHKLLELKGKTKATTEKEHQSILDQIFGVEINQFPAHLSVINLAMQGIVLKTKQINVIVSDFFDVKPYGEWFLKEYKLAHLNRDETKTGTYRFFDCIVANPPYIRQEIIPDKKKLQDIVKYEKANIDKTSDIYSYFFVHASQFLKNGGRLGFITSNKWLEVKYGKSLQKFFFDNHKIIAVIEFDAGVFGEVDVNTCVTILQKEKDSKKRLGNRVKFVRVKKQVGIEELVRFIETTEKDYEDTSIRLIITPQFKLEKESKWSMYLRAPNAYHKIIKNQKLTKLGDICEINRGITSGANDFFYLGEKEIDAWNLENKFLMKLIKSPKDLDCIKVKKSKYYVIYVSKSKKELEETKLLDYIKYGEDKKIHLRPTVKGRAFWYSLGDRKSPKIIFPRLIWESKDFYWNEAGVLVNDIFYEIEPFKKSDTLVILGLLNSSITSLLIETLGRSYGGGVLELKVYETKTLPIVDPSKLTKIQREKIEKEFKELSEIPFSDKKRFEDKRKELDSIIFDILGLSQNEREQVYQALDEALQLRIKRKEKKVLVK